MFERYTENARRVIFFARYEASQFGSPYIESEHLLLGLVREAKMLAMRFFRGTSADEIYKQVELHTIVREKTATSVDLPLTNECKRILAYAADEAEKLGQKHIGTEHRLLGILREEESFAAQLVRQSGCTLDEVREWLKLELYQDRQRTPEEPAMNPPFRFMRARAVDPLKIVLVTQERREVVELAYESFVVPRIGECVRVGALSFLITEVEYVYEAPMRPLRKIRLIVESV
jgi:ATP-dependent Clp protease ATP-binding subunit ClpA